MSGRHDIDDLLSRAGIDPGTVPVLVPVPGTGQGWTSQADLADGGVIVRLLDEWGLLSGTRTNDGGWHLGACPWDHEHTVPGDNRAAVWAGGKFKCWHGHCAQRHRAEFRAWFSERLAVETGGLFCDVAQLELEAIDPASIAVPVPASMPASTAPGSEQPDPGARAFLREMIWVKGQGKFFSRRSHGLATRESVNMAYWLPLRNVLVTPGPNGRLREIMPSDWFMRNPYRVEVDNLTYWPGGGEVVDDPSGAARYANRWRPCVLGQTLAQGPRITHSQVRPWLNLVGHVLGNEGGRFMVRALDWMALIVGAPGLKPGWHLIVQGAQGIGKDLMMLPVVFAVGAANVGMVSAVGLHRDHNPWAEKRLILASELKQTTIGSATGRDQYNTLKALTENTSPTIAINEKNEKVYHARNVGAFYMTSNEKDALALDQDDRRFVVAGSTADCWAGIEYTRLIEWLGGEQGVGAELVAAWLRQRWAWLFAAHERARARDPLARTRLSVLTGRAFDTLSKREMVDAADPVRAWTREQIEDGAWPDLMSSADVDERYRLAHRSGVFKIAVSTHHWGRVLRELGGKKIYEGAPVRLPDGRKARVWAVRKPERFNGMSEAQIAKAYKT